MANVLPRAKQLAVLAALVEGSSIRSTERMTGVHRDTIMKLLVRVGEGCIVLLDERMRNLSCTRLEIDEFWAFIGKKQRQVKAKDDASRVGDCWTYVAIDAETKLVPSFMTGKRDRATTDLFIDDLSRRLKNRVQISSDGLKLYVKSISDSFGRDVDYGQIVKSLRSNGDRPG
jgi:transposase-like protein